MSDRKTDTTNKVVYLKPAHARAARQRVFRDDLSEVGWSAGRRLGHLMTFVLSAGCQVVRLVVCALLVLFEPLLRIVLLPVAFLSFVMTLIFGFAMDAPHFPKWGMLVFSVAALLVYWLYLGVMGVFMRRPRGRA